MSKFKLFNYFEYIQNKTICPNIYSKVKEHKYLVPVKLYRSKSSNFFSTVRNSRFPFLNENKKINYSDEDNLFLKTIKKISRNFANKNNKFSLSSKNSNKNQPFRNYININNLVQLNKKDEKNFISNAIEKEKDILISKYNSLLKIKKPSKKINRQIFSKVKVLLEEKLIKNIFEEKKKSLSNQNEKILKDFKNQIDYDFKEKLNQTGQKIRKIKIKLNNIVNKIPSMFDKDYDDIMIKMEL